MPTYISTVAHRSIIMDQMKLEGGNDKLLVCGDIVPSDSTIVEYALKVSGTITYPQDDVNWVTFLVNKLTKV